MSLECFRILRNLVREVDRAVVQPPPPPHLSHDRKNAAAVSTSNTTKVLYCTEAAVALLMQSHVQGSASAHKPENITMVIIDEVHTRFVQSDYALAFALLAMQLSDKIRLVLMSAIGDHDLVKIKFLSAKRSC